METNQSGQIVGAYANGLMGPVSKRNAANQYGYLMTDALGTVRNIVDANKDTKMTYKYDIFGAIREAVGTDPVGIPQTFTGKELDTDSGLHYFGARYYDSALGRFITADSWTWGPDDERAFRELRGVILISASGSLVPLLLGGYIYCAGDPLSLVDPTGHISYAEAQEYIQQLGKFGLGAVGLTLSCFGYFEQPAGIATALGIVVGICGIIMISEVENAARDKMIGLAVGLIAFFMTMLALSKLAPRAWAIAGICLNAIATVKAIWDITCIKKGGAPA